MRTGRAHPSLIEHLKVDYYGSDVPLQQVASISIEDARTLVVSPWEKGVVAAIEKAIHKSELGLTPNTAGTVIRIPLPPLTEDRRRDITKIVRHDAENARVSVRSVRRDTLADLKDMLKEKMISQDDERRGLGRSAEADRLVTSPRSTSCCRPRKRKFFRFEGSVPSDAVSIPLPAHIAIVMDGNGRWARARGALRGEGHRAGVDRVRMVVEECVRRGIGALTLFAFSRENWGRPRDEVMSLMALFLESLEAEIAELHRNGVRVRFIGIAPRSMCGCATAWRVPSRSPRATRSCDCRSR